MLDRPWEPEAKDLQMLTVTTLSTKRVIYSSSSALSAEKARTHKRYSN